MENKSEECGGFYPPEKKGVSSIIAMGKEMESNTNLLYLAMGKEKMCTTDLLCLAMGKEKEYNTDLLFLAMGNFLM